MSGAEFTLERKAAFTCQKVIGAMSLRPTFSHVPSLRQTFSYVPAATHRYDACMRNQPSHAHTNEWIERERYQPVPTVRHRSSHTGRSLYK